MYVPSGGEAACYSTVILATGQTLVNYSTLLSGLLIVLVFVVTKVHEAACSLPR